MNAANEKSNSEKSHYGTSNSINSQHTIGVSALCLCSLANAFVMISTFPYSGYMVLFLLRGTTPETAGPYAGLLAASFMAGRFVTAYEWGRVADKYGRILCLQASMILSAVFLILFGMAQSYTMAIVWRCCLGMVNAVTSTSKTLASEMSHGDELLERRAMGLVIGMRSWGFLLGPAIGGLLAEPQTQYPQKMWFQSGWRKSLLETYPFLLPNLVVAICCLVGALSATWFIDETLTIKEHWTPRKAFDDLFHGLSGCWMNISQSWRPRAPPRGEESKVLLPNEAPTDDSIIESPPEASIWSRKSTRKHLIAHWVFSFVVVVIDEAFPLFCMSTVGGLSLEEASIGQILSMAGLLFALCQYVVYATIVHRYGLYPSIELGCLFGLVPATLIPLAVLMEQRPWWLMFGLLGMILGACKIFTCMCFASLAIATNKTVPASQRAKTNGLVLVGGSVTKGLGPIFAGFLVTTSFSPRGLVPAEYGSVAIFGTVGILGVIVSALIWRLKYTTESVLVKPRAELEPPLGP
jgi:MFS family permease